MRGLFLRLAAVALAFGPIAASGVNGPTVVMTSAGEGGGAVERFTIRFSEPMVALGDPRLPGPFDVACAVAGEGRWIDQQTFVHEFSRALPGGISCTLTLKPDLKSLAGQAITGQRRFTIDTGGPAVRAIPADLDGSVSRTHSVATLTPEVDHARSCPAPALGDLAALPQ